MKKAPSLVEAFKNHKILIARNKEVKKNNFKIKEENEDNPDFFDDLNKMLETGGEMS